MNNIRQYFINLKLQLMNTSRKLVVTILELLPSLFLASYICSPYLDFRKNYFVSGYEYILVTISHYIWDYFPKCGNCVLWNGYLNGGMPAFAEMHGAVLHPLVILTTLLWGVTNGSKIIAFVSLIISGIATWWMAKELDTSRLSRIWISLLGVIGGHIIGRLESGNIVLVLSVASASLIFPMILRINKKITSRRIAILALLMAFTWLSGQGYIQIGVVVGWFPAFIFLFYQTNNNKQEKLLAFGKSLLLSIFLSGIWVLPTLHFFSQVDKFTMVDFKSLQPFNNIPLDLVISDPGLYTQSYLGMDGFPYEHINYIGWIPVIFSIIAAFFALKKDHKRTVGALLLSILLVMIISSRGVMLFLKDYIPFVMKFRALSVATSLMVPPILGLAALGFDRVYELEWPRIMKYNPEEIQPSLSISLKWLILLPVMLLSFKDIIPFAQNYIHLRNIQVSENDLAFLQVSDTQWVTPPNNDWFPTLMAESRKVIMTDRPWVWKDRQRLSGYLQLVSNPNNDELEDRISREKDFDVLKHQKEFYSSILAGDEITNCNAIAAGGNINVTCNSPKSGILTVHDYQWSGWYAWVDGKPQPILSGDWLSVDAPAGNHVYSFRYRPWDVYAGLGLTIIALGIVFFMIYKKDKTEEE
jgi:hypothetical protein